MIQFKRLQNIAAKPFYAVKNEADMPTIYLYEAIGSFFGVTAEEFAKDLEALRDKPVIALRINSPGGDVFAAKAMAQLLRDHPAKVVAYIDGIAASAATTVANGADEVIIATGAMYMIHNAWTFAGGDYREFEKTAQLLKKVNDTIAADYVAKTGKDPEQIANWMNEETWFSAQEAVDNGFANALAQQESSGQARNLWDLTGYSKAPANLMDVQAEPDPDIENMQRHLRMLELAN